MNQKNKIPWWASKYPFPPDKKKPMLIRQENEIYFSYGKGNDIVTCEIFISTDNILLSAMTIPPGQSFQPPDIHTGDEMYYILKGIASVYNPETGQIIDAAVDSVVFIPANCWHLIYNFSEEDTYLCAVLEGQPWSPEAISWVEKAELKPVGYKN